MASAIYEPPLATKKDGKEDWVLQSLLNYWLVYDPPYYVLELANLSRISKILRSCFDYRRELTKARLRILPRFSEAQFSALFAISSQSAPLSEVFS